MANTNWAKIIAAVGVAASGALAALAASDTVSPQVAALCTAGIAILGMLGVYHAPGGNPLRAAASALPRANAAAPAPPPPPDPPAPPPRPGLP